MDNGRAEHLANSLASVEEQIADCVHQLIQLGLARATVRQMLDYELGSVPAVPAQPGEPHQTYVE